MLERSLVLAEISCGLTLEAKEWDRLLGYHLIIRKVVLTRVTNLSSALVPVFINIIGILTRLDFEFRKFR
jgi:hypothetical protein